MTDLNKEEGAPAIPAASAAGMCGIPTYFQSLFSAPGSEPHGWSPPYTCPAGVDLFLQNEPVSRAYFIEGGIVKESFVGEEGRELIIGLRRKGWLLGVTNVCIDEAVYPAAARTLTPCRLRSIAAKTLMNLLMTDLALSLELNRMFSRELRSKIDQIVSLGSMPAVERLRRFLRDLAEAQEAEDLRAKDRLVLPLTGDELAEIIAVTPQHLYRLLKDDEVKAYVQKGRKTLTLLHPGEFLKRILPAAI